jgi:hypothetical protein
MKYTLGCEAVDDKNVWTLTFAEPVYTTQNGVSYDMTGYREVCRTEEFEVIGNNIDGMLFDLFNQFDQDLFNGTAKKEGGVS